MNFNPREDANQSIARLVKISLFALLLTIIPLPTILKIISPFWVLLSYCFWLVNTKSNYPYTTAFILGLTHDVITGALFGQTVLALLLSGSFIKNVQQSFLVSNTTTQQVYIFVASDIYLFTFWIVNALSIKEIHLSPLLLLAPFTTALFWAICRRFS